jgi:hypothetical protein
MPKVLKPKSLLLRYFLLVIRCGILDLILSVLGSCREMPQTLAYRAS